MYELSYILFFIILVVIAFYFSNNWSPKKKIEGRKDDVIGSGIYVIRDDFDISDKINESTIIQGVIVSEDPNSEIAKKYANAAKSKIITSLPENHVTSTDMYIQLLPADKFNEEAKLLDVNISEEFPIFFYCYFNGEKVLTFEGEDAIN